MISCNYCYWECFVWILDYHRLLYQVYLRQHIHHSIYIYTLVYILLQYSQSVSFESLWSNLVLYINIVLYIFLKFCNFITYFAKYFAKTMHMISWLLCKVIKLQKKCWCIPRTKTHVSGSRGLCWPVWLTHIHRSCF